MAIPDTRPPITAILGPTNTGKTYLAIERMLEHQSGMIGFPLRLLARENYDRVVRLKGARQVALVTGEEKIVPAKARYFLCTVESMPLDRKVEFLAIDEIQLCADAERGHVFTDRLLRARGSAETMFLGADTIRPLIRLLVPEAVFVGRPRLSQLGYAGVKKIARLPSRSAVVAFNLADVYALAEVLRHRRGGAAVVLGALSPRTRNAQVAMYQQGEVDYLVATDAIGMGLNMDIGHVWFAGIAKFDGRRRRALDAAEIAQIAGRAGRHLSNGTFGVLGSLGPLDPEIVDAVENHRFPPLKAIAWRNAALDFRSPKALLRSLDAPPPAEVLYRPPKSVDHLVLGQLAADAEVAARAANPALVRLLWDVCQIPDFRKTLAETHTRMLRQIFLSLATGGGRLDTDWMARQLARLQRIDGDIETLMGRIAHVRTLTYVSHRADWLADAAHWQERARAAEDRLSDALHEQLTQRFVDRRAAAISRGRSRGQLLAGVTRDGGVVVEGAHFGHIEGFRFRPDIVESAAAQRVMLAAAVRALAGEVAARVLALAAAGDDAFRLGDDGSLIWREAPIARLSAAPMAIAPMVRVLPSELLSATQREAIRRRLAVWLDGHLGAALAPLARLRQAELSGAARGVAFQLVEALGSLPRHKLGAQIGALTAADRATLKRLGVRLGMETVFLPALLKPRAAQLRALLWAVHRGAELRAPPPPGRVTVAVEDGAPAEFYEAIGYRVVGARAIRVDILDRLAVALRHDSENGAFALAPALLSMTGLGHDALAGLVVGLGYRAVVSQIGMRFVRVPRPDRHAQRNRHARPATQASGATSPFAVLRGLRRS